MAPRKPYAVETTVSVTSSRIEIEGMLTKFGASSFAFASYPNSASIMFECKGRRIRFDLKLPREHTEAKTQKLHRSRWRALFLAIKAKLVSVDTSIETFESAFLAHIVLVDGHTVSEMVTPAIKSQYETGKMTPLLLSGPTK